MAQYKYAFSKFNRELMARAVGRDAAVSTKQAIEICNYLRHKKLAKAKDLLEKVIQKKQAVPFRRFTNALGHKRGKIGAGRYPVKASMVFLKLLESVEANAQTKGFNTSDLEIIHICAHQAHRPVHYGRNPGREMKRSHVEVVVQETTKQKKEKEEKKAEATKEKKVEKKEEKKHEKKEQVQVKPKTESKPAETHKEQSSLASQKSEKQSFSGAQTSKKSEQPKGSVKPAEKKQEAVK